jgi:hypothetical protein
MRGADVGKRTLLAADPAQPSGKRLRERTARDASATCSEFEPTSWPTCDSFSLAAAEPLRRTKSGLLTITCWRSRSSAERLGERLRASDERRQSVALNVQRASRSEALTMSRHLSASEVIAARTRTTSGSWCSCQARVKLMASEGQGDRVLIRRAKVSTPGIVRVPYPPAMSLSRAGTSQGSEREKPPRGRAVPTRYPRTPRSSPPFAARRKRETPQQRVSSANGAPLRVRPRKATYGWSY